MCVYVCFFRLTQNIISQHPLRMECPLSLFNMVSPRHLLTRGEPRFMKSGIQNIMLVNQILMNSNIYVPIILRNSLYISILHITIYFNV